MTFLTTLLDQTVGGLKPGSVIRSSRLVEGFTAEWPLGSAFYVYENGLWYVLNSSALHLNCKTQRGRAPQKIVRLKTCANRRIPEQSTIKTELFNIRDLGVPNRKHQKYWGSFITLKLSFPAVWDFLPTPIPDYLPWSPLVLKFLTKACLSLDGIGEISPQKTVI